MNEWDVKNETLKQVFDLINTLDTTHFAFELDKFCVVHVTVNGNDGGAYSVNYDSKMAILKDTVRYFTSKGWI